MRTRSDREHSISTTIGGSLDERLDPHQGQLSPHSEAFAHDLNNIACYVSQILWWLAPDRMWDGRGVVIVGAMTEATLVAIRCGGDALAGLLGYVAATKPGQAPRNSLNDLLTWATRNPHRLDAEAASLLGQNWTWFHRAKALRDHLVHGGAHANIFTDRKQFYLWLHSNRVGWITREPLLPVLRDLLVGLLRASDDVGELVGRCLAFPQDRENSRVLHGIMIPALNELVKIADDYAAPSP